MVREPASVPHAGPTNTNPRDQRTPHPYDITAAGFKQRDGVGSSGVSGKNGLGSTSGPKPPDREVGDDLHQMNVVQMAPTEENALALWDANGTSRARSTNL